MSITVLSTNGYTFRLSPFTHFATERRTSPETPAAAASPLSRGLIVFLPRSVRTTLSQRPGTENQVAPPGDASIFGMFAAHLIG
jgi:hypothetical protein